MKKNLPVILVLIFGVVAASFVKKFLDRIPTAQDAIISSQILGDFENVARTNVSLNRSIKRYQQKPDWSDEHLEIATLSRHNLTLIHIIGNLNEREKKILRDIAFDLDRHYNRDVELKFETPTVRSKIDTSSKGVRDEWRLVKGINGSVPSIDTKERFAKVRPWRGS